MEVICDITHHNREWLEKAPEPPPYDPDVERRFALAYSHPITSSANENTTKALQNLLKFGLIAECTEGSSLAHYIADTVLNHALYKDARRDETPNEDPPCEFQLHLGAEGQTIIIPPRSRLMLLQLSDMLGVKIYLFSTRSKPVCFGSPSATPSSIAFLHRIDSYYGTSEFLVIVPSSHTPVVDDLPAQMTASTSSSNVPAAMYRTTKRGNNKRPLQVDNSLTREECIEAVKSACQDSMHSRMTNAITSIFNNKKIKLDEDKQSALSRKCSATKESFLKESNVPKGIMDSALRIVLEAHPQLNSSFSKQDITKKIQPEKKNVDIWHEVVQSSYDPTWIAALAQAKMKEKQSVTPSRPDAEG
ncbi:hypothetical protein BGX27_005166, partial [Mortierella sp. AM989]